MASTFNFFPATENEKKKSTLDYNAEQFVVRLLKKIFIDKDLLQFFFFLPYRLVFPPTEFQAANPASHFQ